MVLIDLSGTLHIDNTVIPGAVEALNRCFFFLYFGRVFQSLDNTMAHLPLRRLHLLAPFKLNELVLYRNIYN